MKKAWFVRAVLVAAVMLATMAWAGGSSPEEELKSLLKTQKVGEWTATFMDAYRHITWHWDASIVVKDDKVLYQENACKELKTSQVKYEREWKTRKDEEKGVVLYFQIDYPPPNENSYVIELLAQ